jgi:hypothetical protein
MNPVCRSIERRGWIGPRSLRRPQNFIVVYSGSRSDASLRVRTPIRAALCARKSGLLMVGALRSPPLPSPARPHCDPHPHPVRELDLDRAATDRIGRGNFRSDPHWRKADALPAAPAIKLTRMNARFSRDR